ncbi:MAG: hypothetical protein P1U74_04530 [Legionellaceae bacterium]|nr:hypothetical protein [Legionellaceae bacterium]
MSNCYGIISGAGPMAGVLLYRQIIELIQAQGGWEDADFPNIVMMNIPFSDMLGGGGNDAKVRNELLLSLQRLSAQVDYIYIACQTLHAFLSRSEMEEYNVINLLDLIKAEIGMSRKPILVAASNTSRRFNLHAEITSLATVQYFNPNECDSAIQAILRGSTPDLSWLIKKSFENNIVLGCTEFSVSCYGMKFNWIDPIQLAAIDVVKKFII